MNASVTRPQLIPLEGQLTYSTGRIKDWKRAGDFDDILLTSVKLWRWDGLAVVNTDATPDATADHLWLRCTRGSVASERLHLTFGVGTIRFYTRADGSYDLGLQAKPCVDLDDLLRQAVSTYNDRFKLGTDALKATLKLVATALLYAAEQGKDGYAFSRVKTIPQAVKHLARRFEYIEASLNATQTRLDAQAHLRRGPCKNLDLPRTPKPMHSARGFLPK